MENKKTISHLNSKAWYRLLKVVYVFLFMAIFALIVFLDQSTTNLDVSNSKVICQYGNEKQFLIKDIFPGNLNPDLINAPTLYLNNKYITDWDSLPPVQRTIMSSCGINDLIPDIVFMASKFPKGTTAYGLNDKQLIINPYRIETMYKSKIGYYILSFIILFFV